jgi:hypothetical protein
MSVQLLEAYLSEHYPELRKPIAEIEKSCCDHRLTVFDFDKIKNKICKLKGISPTPKSCDALFFDTEARQIVFVEMKDLQSAWGRFQSEAGPEAENRAEKKRREFYGDVFDELEFSSLESRLFTSIDNFCNSCRNDYMKLDELKTNKKNEQEYIRDKVVPIFSKKLYEFYCETKKK